MITQGFPVMGTNRTGSVVSVSMDVVVRRMTRSSWLTVPTGIAIKPPIFNCCTSAGGSARKWRLLSTHYCLMVITRVWSQVAGNPASFGGTLPA